MDTQPPPKSVGPSATPTSSEPVVAPPPTGPTSMFWTYTPFPVVLFGLAAVWSLTVKYGWDMSAVGGASAVVVLLIALALERARPLRSDWAMTRRTFFGRDGKYILFGAPILFVLAPVLVVSFGIELVGRSEARFDALPLVVEALLALATFDFVYYWYHRSQHRLERRGGLIGRLGRLLWKFHAPHHQPRQVYVLMHPVFHPLDGLVVRLGLQSAVFWVVGFSSEAVFIALGLTVVCDVFGHCNSDIRIGPFNYFFISTESHRLHHSGERKHDGNYASTLAIWDIMFGTFVRQPGVYPERLGLWNNAAEKPAEKYVASVLAPFRSV